MKRILSLLLVIALCFASLPAVAFAENADAENADAGNAETTTDLETEQDLSGKYYTDIFGDGSEYQVANVKPIDGTTQLELSYIAADDCYIDISIIDDDTKNVLCKFNAALDSEANEVIADVGFNSYPEYYRIEAVITDGTQAVSQIFTNYEHTHEYEEFMSMTTNDEEFAGKVIVDYGVNEEGQENFAVVKEDVKVIYVDTISDVEISENEEVSLFSGEMTTDYTFTTVENDEVLDSIKSGDKVLVMPSDDLNEAKTFVVNDVEETVNLFSGEETVTVNADEEAVEMEEFFDYVRINIEIEADTDDLDTSTKDDDIEYIEETDEEVELFGSASVSKTKSKTFSANQSFSNIKVNDTFTLTATISLSVNYSSTSLKTVTASTSLNVTNTFKVSSTRSASTSKEWQVGSIPIGTIYGVSFSIPVSITFSASFGSNVTFTATQNASASVTVTYDRGSYWCSTSRSASSGKELTTQAKVTVTLGVKASVKASISLVGLSLYLTGEAGVRAEGVVESVNDTSSYSHNCYFCLDGKMYVYITPSFKLTWGKKTLANKTWSSSQKLFLNFYASRRSSGWKFGTGDCTNKTYLVTITVKKNNTNSNLSGVTVKNGSTKYGTTNSSGKFSKKLSPGSYTLKLSKSGYNTGSVSFKVGTSTINKTVRLYRTGGANETYYSMDDLLELTTEDFEAFMSEPETVANTIFRIENAEDFQKLAEFTNNSGNTTDGLRFILNNASGTIDLTGIDWTPIGTETAPFMGELDGNGFTITGLTIDSDKDYTGLFGKTSGVLIHDLGLSDVSVKGKDYTGALLGYTDSESNIYDVYSTGNVSGSNAVGGLIGYMDNSKLINTYNTAEISGTNNVGGLVGIFNHTDTLGQVTNSYSVGEIECSGINGGVCGSVNYSATVELTETTEEEVEEAHIVGIQYAYYLNTVADSPAGSTQDECTVIAYPVTAEQANGEGSGTPITEDANYAMASTLYEALNNWYAAFGSAKENAESDDTTTEDIVTDEESVAIPEASINDYYNKWYLDHSLNNSGYPLFAEKPPVYALTVEYKYEDGTTAKPTVVLYLSEGQAYDVDSYEIEGYHTDDIEYTGTMPAAELNYLVVYSPNINYTGTGTTLYNSFVTDRIQAQKGTVYSIGNADDLIGLSNYVNAGGSTEGIKFVQTADVVMSEREWTPIGTKDYPFKGVYDAQGLAISGLTYDTTVDYVGLFGHVESAEITRLSVTNANMSGNNYVGTIAGYAKDSVLTVIHSSSALTGKMQTGGIIGASENTVLMEVSSKGMITGTENTGGLVGELKSGTIINSYNEATVDGTKNVGGLIGKTTSGDVFNNYNIGNVGSIETQYVGGLVGNNTNALVENAYNSGVVKGNTYVGAIAGVSTDKVTSVYYLDGVADKAIGSGNIGECSNVASEMLGTTLLTNLNDWVNAKASSKYFTWGMPEDGTHPTFGDYHSSWLVDLTFGVDGLSFTFDNAYAPDASVYVVTYDSTGKLLDCKVYTNTGEYSFQPDAATSYARAFLWDMNLIPVFAPVVAKK